MEEIATLVNSFGFPIAVSAFLLVIVTKQLKELGDNQIKILTMLETIYDFVEKKRK